MVACCQGQQVCEDIEQWNWRKKTSHKLLSGSEARQPQILWLDMRNLDINPEQEPQHMNPAGGNHNIYMNESIKIGFPKNH